MFVQETKPLFKRKSLHLHEVCFLNCRYHLKHIIQPNRSALDYCTQICGTNALIYALIVKTAVTGTHCRI